RTPPVLDSLPGRKTFTRTGVFPPFLRDNGPALRLDDRAHLFHNRQFLGRQGLGEFVEVTIRRRQWLRLLNFFACSCHISPPCEKTARVVALLDSRRPERRSAFRKAVLQRSGQSPTRSVVVAGSL